MQAMWGGYDLQANHLLERSFATAVQAMISWPTSFLNDILIPHFGLWPSGKPCAWKNLCYHIPGYDILTSHLIGRSSATAVQTMKWVIDMYKWEPNIQKKCTSERPKYTSERPSGGSGADGWQTSQQSINQFNGACHVCGHKWRWLQT